ncbi:MAG: BatD family protein, partial [Romboutsia sp.]|nr:BatD family protein [Romboutsia sp.]
MLKPVILRNKIFISSLLLCFANLALCAEFVASINKRNFSTNDFIELKLSLIDANATADPDLSDLEKDFSIHNLRRQYSESIINGKSSRELMWNVLIIAKYPTVTSVPAISIQTNKGKLSTKPIDISVTETANSNLPIKIFTEISNAEPYIKQPITFKIKLVSEINIDNIQLDPIKLDNAIIEPVGKANSYDDIMNGTYVKVIEVKYLVTAFTEGNIEIPAVVLTGSYEVTNYRSRNMFIDPFGMMQQYAPF